MYPRLAKLANTALWLHAMEEVVSFERSLAPLRGLAVPMSSPELMESTAEPWNQASCLELLATNPVSFLCFLQCPVTCFCPNGSDLQWEDGAHGVLCSAEI